MNKHKIIRNLNQLSLILGIAVCFKYEVYLMAIILAVLSMVQVRRETSINK